MHRCASRLILVAWLVVATSCGSKKEKGTPSTEQAKTRAPGTSSELIAADKKALVAEMIRNAKPPDKIKRVWDASCDQVGVFTLAQGCLPMPHARLRSWAGRIYLVLAPKQPPTCDRRVGPQIPKTQPELSVMLPPGMRRKSARGRPIGAQSSLDYPGGKSLSTHAGPSRITLEPGPFRAGSRVAGTLSIDGVGAGRFSAEPCPDDFAAIWDGPEFEPADSLRVMVSGRPYPVVTTLFHASSFERYTIVSAHLFDKKADCTTPRHQSVGAGVITLTRPQPFALVGSEQRAYAKHVSLEQKAILDAYGWGRWEEVSTKPGSKIRARIHVTSEPHKTTERALLVSGPLEGTLCPAQ